MRILDELMARNFGIYGQWFAIISFILCFALGIAKILSFSLMIIFGALSLAMSVLIFVVEIPWLSKHIDGLRHINTNTNCAIFYIVCSITLWLSLIIQVSAMIAPAVMLALTSFWYAIAAYKKQDRKGSVVLGGTGLVARQIVSNSATTRVI